jgi:hypothetical protein
MNSRIKPTSQVGGVAIRYFVPKRKDDYIKNVTKVPFIAKGSIWLPDDSRYEMEVEGREFMVTTHDPYGPFGGYGPTFYGGDRNGKPFLYGFTNRVSRLFEEEGWAAFHEAVIPNRIRLLHGFHDRRDMYRRMGHLHAVKTYWTEEEVVSLVSIFKGGTLKVKPVKNRRIRLSGHRITGRYAETQDHDLTWAVSVDGQVVTDCDERVNLPGVWIFQFSRHLDYACIDLKK